MKRIINDLWLHRVIIAVLLLSLIVIPFLLPTKTKPTRLSSGSAFIPAGTIFGLPNTQYIVESAYYYESSLLNYSAPIADTDYILPYGSQELVKLPGLSNIHYTLIGGSYIDGSGYYLAFQAPNGGRFALLHLSRTFVGVPRIKVGQHHKYKDSTFLGAHKFTHKNVGAGYYYGGEAIGYSGWPTWSEYANGGTPGPYDAHLCVVYDQYGSYWFYYLLHLPKPTPKPTPKPVVKFNYTLWYHYLVKHHLHKISPFYGHHHTTVADVWHHHMSKCWGVVHQWHWYKATHSYTKQVFRNCTIFVWDHNYYKAKVT